MGHGQTAAKGFDSALGSRDVSEHREFPSRLTHGPLCPSPAVLKELLISRTC